MRTTRTRVGIVGAGPAGLVLGHLLARAGIDAVILEARSRAYVEQRQRAGLLEHDVVRLLREVGLGRRLEAEGLTHHGAHLQFGGERHRIDFQALTGRNVTIYAQTEIVKDVIGDRLARGLPLEFEVDDVSIEDVTSARPRVRYRGADGEARELVCDAVAGCDGFHGVSRARIPGEIQTVWECSYPYAWLGILADVAPSCDELIYARHPEGFALHTMRSPSVTRLYLQVAEDESLDAWPDERIWSALDTRLALAGWTLGHGPVRDKSITAMRSFVSAPMRHGRLFLAGDAAHIVPPTGAKGLNLAVADVVVLARALCAWLRAGDETLVDSYSETCLARAWRCTWFSSWMTGMLHTPPGVDAFGAELQLAQLRQLTSSRAAATALAESYTGLPLPEL